MAGGKVDPKSLGDICTLDSSWSNRLHDRELDMGKTCIIYNTWTYIYIIIYNHNYINIYSNTFKQTWIIRECHGDHIHQSEGIAMRSARSATVWWWATSRRSVKDSNIKIYSMAYVREYPHKIGPKIWYSTSILGSWNSHWYIEQMHVEGFWKD